MEVAWIRVPSSVSLDTVQPNHSLTTPTHQPTLVSIDIPSSLSFKQWYRSLAGKYTIPMISAYEACSQHLVSHLNNRAVDNMPTALAAEQ